MPPSATRVPAATTPEDNNYCPWRGSYDACYSGDLNEQDSEYEARDAAVAATRAEFARTPASKNPAD